MLGIWYKDSWSGEVVLCECEGGIYYEKAFETESDATAYVESMNADWAIEAARNGWKGSAPYFVAPIPSNVTIATQEDDSASVELTPAESFLTKNPTELARFGGFKLYEHPTRGDTASIYMTTPSGQLINTSFYDLGDFDLALCLDLEESTKDENRIQLSGKIGGFQ